MAGAKLRVFVAEDDDLIAMVLEDMLDELNCTVVATAGSVSDALAFLDQNTCDLAIVDVRLRDGSIEPVGDELMMRKIPFALATGFASEELVRRFNGMPVLHKPYMIEDVRAALARLAGAETAPA